MSSKNKEKQIAPIPWMKYKPIYFLLSLIVIVLGIIAIFSWGFSLGLEFKGGSLLEYRLPQEMDAGKLEEILHTADVEVTSIQKSEDNLYLVKADFLDEEMRVRALEALKNIGEVEELQFQNIGPSVSRELIKKTIIAILLASTSILFWVWYQFKNPLFGASAILAMLHDSLVLIGVFVILGHFYGAEIDFLFVTAMLTTLSFSVHDTIVVFDRIREVRKKHGGDYLTIANKAISETMRRSIVNSLTIIFVLLSLLIFGGESIRWFAAALLVGAIAGTYSSPFVAVPIFVTASQLFDTLKQKRNKK